MRPGPRVALSRLGGRPDEGPETGGEKVKVMAGREGGGAGRRFYRPSFEDGRDEGGEECPAPLHIC